MQSKTERFEMRLDQGALDRLDAWRAKQPDLPSRAEAVRRLVDRGVAPPKPARPAFRLGDGEKLILLMLCEVYRHLKINGDLDPNFIESAIQGGHLWGLDWKYPGITSDRGDASDDVVKDVTDILEMWSFITSGYARLTKQEKALVEKEAEPFGTKVAFPGFDGNNESRHLSVARFMVKELERFDSYAGVIPNSHSPVLAMYHRMLKVFTPIRARLAGRDLTSSEIIDLLKAMRYPE